MLDPCILPLDTTLVYRNRTIHFARSTSLVGNLALMDFVTSFRGKRFHPMAAEFRRPRNRMTSALITRRGTTLPWNMYA
jgi:hypothetical protein